MQFWWFIILWLSKAFSFRALDYLENPVRMITFDTDNNIIIKGAIDKKLVTDVLHQLHKTTQDHLFLYIDTPGGSVEHGNKIVGAILQRNVSCIVERAYSMGFVILQACTQRYILPFGSIMQHQMSFMLAGEKLKVEHQLDHIQQMERFLVKIQAERIGMSERRFRDKTSNEWWLYGQNAIHHNCIDGIVNANCSKRLTLQNYTITQGNSDYIYSKCPLIPGEVKIKKRRNSDGEHYIRFPF